VRIRTPAATLSWYLNLCDAVCPERGRIMWTGLGRTWCPVVFLNAGAGVLPGGCVTML
jgi:hypothetical protein